MSNINLSLKGIERFLDAIGPMKDVYRSDSFSYIAIRTVDGLVLIQGTLYLNVQPPTIPLKTVNVGRTQAGHFYLTHSGLHREQMISQLYQGKIATPDGELHFPPNRDSGQYGVQFQPYHEIGVRAQRRLIHLALLGGESAQFLDQPNLDWELRSATVPYDGLQDLLQEFQPGALRGVNCVELAAFGVATVDAQSIVNGDTATLVVRTASHAEREKISLGIRVLERGRVIKREHLCGETFRWDERDGGQVATTSINVPPATVIHGIANYNGVAQHHYYFGDPNSFQNPRRAGYEAFDPKLNSIRDILAKQQSTRPESRDFEAAMPWLFWMLGFAPAHIGGLPRTRDAVDFVASTPNGNLAVVECTVGLLKEDGKLPKLYDRVQAVRRNLDSSSARYVRILPIIITTKLAEEVRPDLEQAEKLGIHVITREGIDQMLDRTLVPQDADQLFEEAERATKIAKDAREA